jgi:hypothetical protein
MGVVHQVRRNVVRVGVWTDHGSALADGGELLPPTVAFLTARLRDEIDLALTINRAIDEAEDVVS